MPQSPSPTDVRRHPAAPPRTSAHRAGMAVAGLLLGGHYGLAGTTFGPAPLAALALLFTGCAAVVAFCLWERRTFSGTPVAHRRSRAIGKFCAAAFAALTLATLVVAWLGGLAAPAHPGGGPGWPAHGLAVPTLVAAFVALPLLTAAWLGLAASTPAVPSPGRPRRGLRPTATDPATDPAEDFDRWLEAEVSAQRSPASAAPPA